MNLLITFLAVALSATALAQSGPKPTYRNLSTSINNDEQGNLSIVLNGLRNDGQRILYNRTFNVAGLSKAQRDALTNRVLDSLGVHVAEPPKPPAPPTTPAEPDGETVTFVCPTCTGKMDLTIQGQNRTVTLSVTQSSGGRTQQPAFPFIATLPSGAYRYQYTQDGVRQVDLSFTVRAGEKNVVTVK